MLPVVVDALRSRNNFEVVIIYALTYKANAVIILFN